MAGPPPTARVVVFEASALHAEIARRDAALLFRLLFGFGLLAALATLL